MKRENVFLTMSLISIVTRVKHVILPARCTMSVYQPKPIILLFVIVWRLQKCPSYEYLGLFTENKLTMASILLCPQTTTILQSSLLCLFSTSVWNYALQKIFSSSMSISNDTSVGKKSILSLNFSYIYWQYSFEKVNVIANDVHYNLNQLRVSNAKFLACIRI